MDFTTRRKHFIGLRCHDVSWQQHNYGSVVRQVIPQLSLLHVLRNGFTGAPFDNATNVGAQHPDVLPFPNLQVSNKTTES